MEISGQEILDGGIDWLHVFFRDTRYTVTSTDCRFESQVIGSFEATIDPDSGQQINTRIYVEDASGFAEGDIITIERGGANAETTKVMYVNADLGFIEAWVTVQHPDKCFVTRETHAFHLAAKLAEIINTPGESVAGRFGPDQSGVITASAGGGSSYQSGTMYLEFKSSTADGSLYGKLGNLDRVLVTRGRTINSNPDAQQGFQWTDGSGATYRFNGGDNDTRYRIEMPFGALTDKLGRRVPIEHCRKIYMVFAPRFERTEEELEDGCFLAANVSASDAACSVDDTSKLTGGRYFVGDGTTEERILLGQALPGQITVTRGYESTVPQPWPSGTRMSKLSLIHGILPSGPVTLGSTDPWTSRTDHLKTI